MRGTKKWRGPQKTKEQGPDSEKFLTGQGIEAICLLESTQQNHQYLENRSTVKLPFR